MGRKRVSCVILECDRCGEALEADEPFVTDSNRTRSG